MKKAVVTGAAGFAGCNLVEHLLDAGWYVYAIVRPKSAHNERLRGRDNIYLIELDLCDYDRIPSLIPKSCDAFFHLAWNYADRNDFYHQSGNIRHNIAAVEAASALSCKRILITGSQAEYGVMHELTTEERRPEPINAYGATKAAACLLTKNLAEQRGVEWIWGRVFSLIGRYEPPGRMLPDLVASLRAGKQPRLSSCTQQWDYLDAGDAADAMIALMEKGTAGEIYNIAHGAFRPLRDYTEMVRKLLKPDIKLIYGKRVSPYIELCPSVEKIKIDTGWGPQISFETSVIQE